MASPLGHPEFVKLYGLTATGLRRLYKNESLRFNWADPGQLAREKAFKTLQRCAPPAGLPKIIIRRLVLTRSRVDTLASAAIPIATR